jgi:hypothetical protein
LPTGNYVYTQYYIVPAAAKTLHLDVYATIASTSSLFNTKYAAFILQVINKNEKLADQTYMDGTVNSGLCISGNQ